MRKVRKVLLKDIHQLVDAIADAAADGLGNQVSPVSGNLHFALKFHFAQFSLTLALGGDVLHHGFLAFSTSPRKFLGKVLTKVDGVHVEVAKGLGHRLCEFLRKGFASLFTSLFRGAVINQFFGLSANPFHCLADDVLSDILAKVGHCALCAANCLVDFLNKGVVCSFGSTSVIVLKFGNIHLTKQANRRQLNRRCNLVHLNNHLVDEVD